MTLLRKPALYWLVFAVTTAFAAGGRLSLRLLFDTAIIYLPVVVIQVLAFMPVYWTGRRGLRCGEAVDRFFDGSVPWFLAMIVMGGFAAAATAPESSRWFAPLSAVALIGAIVLTIPLDFRFYRHGLGRSAGRSVTDLVLQRAIGWTATVVYFLWTALPKAGTVVQSIQERLFS